MPRRAAISTARKPSAAERRAKAKAAGNKRKRPAGSDDEASSDDSAAEPTGLTSDEDTSESESDADSDAFSPPESGDEDEEEFEDEDAEVMSASSGDSDEEDDAPARGKGKAARGKPKAKPATNGRAKRVKRASSDADDDEVELADGQIVAGRIFEAPTTGLVPPGQISANTLHFLSQLLYPECNDREWFRAHEPAFRMAEREYRDFVDVLLHKMNEVDDELPLLPAKDICHRIYRDIRFSADKTPYKPNFGMTVGRGGRRGIWAQYHLYIEPGGRTLLACGLWAPEKPILQRFRDRMLADTPGPGPLRDVISTPEFVKLFGKPQPHPKRKRQSIFHHSDELKVAPKGFAKDHPEIDLLKLRSIAVSRHFSDDEVLSPDFADRIKDTVAVMAPLVHTLNDYIMPG